MAPEPYIVLPPGVPHRSPPDASNPAPAPLPLHGGGAPPAKRPCLPLQRDTCGVGHEKSTDYSVLKKRRVEKEKDSNDGNANASSSPGKRDQAVCEPSSSQIEKPIDSKDWSKEDEYILEVLIDKYAFLENKNARYVAICSELPGKTIRDVAERCSWIAMKRTDDIVETSDGLAPETDNLVHDYAIDSAKRNLLKENLRLQSRIKFTLASSKALLNRNKFTRLYKNILKLSDGSCPAPGEPTEAIRMPPLPSLDQNMFASIVPVEYFFG